MSKSFCCFNCGDELLESWLSFLKCTGCGAEYLPYVEHIESNQVLEQVTPPKEKDDTERQADKETS